MGLVQQYTKNRYGGPAILRNRDASNFGDRTIGGKKDPTGLAANHEPHTFDQVPAHATQKLNAGDECDIELTLLESRRKLSRLSVDEFEIGTLGIVHSVNKWTGGQVVRRSYP